MTDPNPLHAVPEAGAGSAVDKPRIERAVREILEAIGEDPDRDGLVRTPARFAAMYEEIFSGLHEDPAEHLNVTFEANHDEMVMVRDIPLFSSCEHHLTPFHGMAHVAYIPGTDGRITGLSKIARLVEGFARRPQVQERLTTQIADALVETLEPKGVFVLIQCEHLCMSMRGAHRDLRGPGALQGQPRDAGRGDQLHRASRKSLLAERFFGLPPVRCVA